MGVKDIDSTKQHLLEIADSIQSSVDKLIAIVDSNNHQQLKTSSQDVTMLFGKINQFDDARWVKNYGNDPARIAETLSDLGQDDVEDILTGYWKLMNTLLNGETNVSTS